MALLGKQTAVEQALEQVAREVGKSAGPPPDIRPLVWLLGLVRGASATQLSRIPIRGVTLGHGEVPNEPAPTTARLGAAEAIPARAALDKLRPTEREAVVLALVGGLEVHEIAIACSIDDKAARGRLERGLAQLMGPTGSTGIGGAR